jgi:DNA-binding GntR family transcriptional regulator
MDEQRRPAQSAKAGFVSPEPISQAIFRHLGQAIISGRLAPGEHLRELQLCEELGCSRSPLREALRMLAAEHLVTIEPRRGARVARLTVKDVMELFEVRAEIEALAARLAAERGSDEELASLELLNQDMAAAVDGRDVGAFFDGNTVFHATIARAARNAYLDTLIRSAADRSFQTLFRTLTQSGHVENAVAKHTELISAMRARDGAQADRCMREHIIAIRDEAVELIRNSPLSDADS